jgi:site-specific DNA recombinase
VLYLCEDQIIDPIDRFLRDEITVTALTDNLRRVADAQHCAALAATGRADDTASIRQTITDADAKIDRYRVALDAGGHPILIAGWITETAAIKKAAQARLDLTDVPPQRMTGSSLTPSPQLSTTFTLIQGADPRDRAELYSRIGLRITCQPGLKTLEAEIVSDDFGRVYNVCPRGDLNPHAR